MSDLNFFGGSPFKIKRPLITTSGIASEIDTVVKKHLDELNGIFGKRIFPPGALEAENGSGRTRLRRARTHNGDVSEKAAKNEEAKGQEVEPDELISQSHTVPTSPGTTTIRRLRSYIIKPLTPKFVPPVDGDSWDDESVAYAFSIAKESDDSISLSDAIDARAELSSLKYSFQNALSANWNTLDYDTRAVLDGYPAVTDYLIAYAYFKMNLTQVNGLTNFLLSNRNGARAVTNYAAVSAARTIIDAERLEVEDYNKDGSEIVQRIADARLSLSSTAFKSSLTALVNDYVFNKTETDLINKATVLGLPPELKPQLIKYIKHSPVKITNENANYFLPVFVSQIVGSIVVPGVTDSLSAEESDQDFNVDYLADDQSMIQVSRSAVKCAAQLFYSMILGDELEVFNTVNYFTHKYLIRGGIEISDSRLRDDLQLYVFSNKFMDLKTNQISDRSRPAERQMFYRQVFNWGPGQVTDDVIINREFSKLWKVLILEAAKYLERAQMSPNPDSYVSRQNVMQAVEDLQYNLSTHCTGMANVITPMIYAELNFVIQRILMHEEVLRQIVPQGGTWWRVVEALFIGMRNRRPRSTVLYNKAKLGNSILRAIAEYDPPAFEKDAAFSNFMSLIEALITTQSILQESLTENLKQGDDDGEGTEAAPRHTDVPENMPPPPSPPPQMMRNGNGAASASEEWNF